MGLKYKCFTKETDILVPCENSGEDTKEKRLIQLFPTSRLMRLMLSMLL